MTLHEFVTTIYLQDVCRSHELICVGGKLYELGQRWVVNASGGLESKGKHSCLFVYLHQRVGCPDSYLNPEGL